jgi:hypothetical protein
MLKIKGDTFSLQNSSAGPPIKQWKQISKFKGYQVYPTSYIKSNKNFYIHN